MRTYYREPKIPSGFLPGKPGLMFNDTYLIGGTLAEAIRSEAAGVQGTLLDFGRGSRPYESFFNVERDIGLDIVVNGHPGEGQHEVLGFQESHQGPREQH